jgi:hypothetical protein
MVRRWSRINCFNFHFKNKKIALFKKNAKIRIFKLTVSTRKFYKKYTKFRRKAFNRIRHKNNWLIYSNIFKFWCFDYLNTKSLYRRFWLINSYKYSFVVFNWSSVKNTNLSLFYNYNYNILSLNSFFLKNNLKNFSLLKNYKNSSLALIEDFANFEDSSLLSLNFSDNIMAEFSQDFNASVCNSESALFFYNIDDYVFQYLKYFYIFLTNLTFLNL